MLFCVLDVWLISCNPAVLLRPGDRVGGLGQNEGTGTDRGDWDRVGGQSGGTGTEWGDRVGGLGESCLFDLMVSTFKH